MKREQTKTLHTDYYNKLLTIVCEALHPFIKDHFETWDLMYNLREDGNEELYSSALKHIEKEINQHFILEEQIILSRLANHISENEVGPIGKLVYEHTYIKEKFNKLKKSIEECGLNDETRNELKFLAYLIMKHIEKEDHYFYPMVGLILTKQERNEIQKELKVKSI